MGLLTVCAQHYEGLAWLLSFYAGLCLMPGCARLWGTWGTGAKLATSQPARRPSYLLEGAYLGLLASMIFVGGALPCGRLYYEVDDGFFGNGLLRISFEYIYAYLVCLPHIFYKYEYAVVRLILLGRRWLSAGHGA